MLGFALFGGLFGAYFVYDSVASCKANRHIATLTNELESCGAILEEWDGNNARARYTYLLRMAELIEKVNKLAENSPVFAAVTSDEHRTEYYEIVNEMCMLSDSQTNDILYKVLHLFAMKNLGLIPVGDCAETTVDHKLFHLLTKISKQKSQ